MRPNFGTVTLFWPTMTAGVLTDRPATIFRHQARNYRLLLRAALRNRVPVLLTGFAFLILSVQVYARFGKGNHEARLNFGDCFAYALAKETGEPLLFKGEDFSRTDVVSAV